MTYGYTREVVLTFEEAVERVESEFAREGFGVLCNIDVKETLKKKLNIDTDKYRILGMCNPEYAHQALEVEKELGLLLPCNVIVYESDGKVFVSAMRPSAVLSIVENPDVDAVAKDVEEMVVRALDRAAEGSG